MQGTTFKLASFIVLSMTAHGLLLFVNRQHEIPLDYQPMGRQILSVSLVANHIPQNNSSTVSASEKNKRERAQNIRVISIRAPSHESSKISRPSEPVMVASRQVLETRIDNVEKNAPHLTVVSQTEIQPDSSISDEALNNAQQNFLLGEIHNRLSQYMSYPAHARRRGWEGSVMIEFNVDEQGFLHNIHLARTSGYTLLDNAALTAVKKVSYIPLNQWGGILQPVALQLPVIYRLTNS